MCALEWSSESPSVGFSVPVCFATRSGGTTIDRDAKGGNPFATALIELSASADVGILDFPERLRALTHEVSVGHQSPEWVGASPSADWRLPHPWVSEKVRRVALVLVVSDYRYSTDDLGGAAWDELRVSAMLARNGFSVTQGVGPDRVAILQAIEEFAERSRDADYAIIYCTGHGVEKGGMVYLLPGDYPMPEGVGAAELAKSAVGVGMLADACSARTLNLVFFAGCRSI